MLAYFDFQRKNTVTLSLLNKLYKVKLVDCPILKVEHKLIIDKKNANLFLKYFNFSTLSNDVSYIIVL